MISHCRNHRDPTINTRNDGLDAKIFSTLLRDFLVDYELMVDGTREINCTGMAHGDDIHIIFYPIDGTKLMGVSKRDGRNGIAFHESMPHNAIFTREYRGAQVDYIVQLSHMY
jgi:hypothetical protein